jgi:small subunit ribosomal protein S4
MGDPSKPRKKYSSPRHPWRADQLAEELYYLGTYGLRNKRELWRAKTELSRIRKQARNLLAAPDEVRAREEKRLLDRLKRMGVVDDGATLDDVLSLTVENLLERRLQTVVWRLGLARTPYQARQMIVHGHIMVGDRRVTIPSFIVERGMEEKVRIREDSPLIKQVAASQGGKEGE